MILRILVFPEWAFPINNTFFFAMIVYVICIFHSSTLSVSVSAVAAISVKIPVAGNTNFDKERLPVYSCARRATFARNNNMYAAIISFQRKLTSQRASSRCVCVGVAGWVGVFVLAWGRRTEQNPSRILNSGIHKNEKRTIEVRFMISA